MREIKGVIELLPADSDELLQVNTHQMHVRAMERRRLARDVISRTSFCILGQRLRQSKGKAFTWREAMQLIRRCSLPLTLTFHSGACSTNERDREQRCWRRGKRVETVEKSGRKPLPSDSTRYCWLHPEKPVQEMPSMPIRICPTKAPFRHLWRTSSSKALASTSC